MDARKFFAAIAQHFREGGITFQKVAVEVASADPDSGSFKHCAEALFAVASYAGHLDRSAGSYWCFRRPAHVMLLESWSCRGPQTWQDRRQRGGPTPASSWKMPASFPPAEARGLFWEVSRFGT